MNYAGKAWFTALSAVFFLVGAAVVYTQYHEGSTRRAGIVTLQGADAVWFGQTLMLVAVLPLVVWLPRRIVGTACVVWWFALMAWIFGPLFLR